MSAPLASHLHLCSTQSFVYGDEERIMSELTKVSGVSDESFRRADVYRRGSSLGL